MKKEYLKPEAEVLEMEASTTMMIGSSVDTEMGDTPSTPDVRGHRGTWGNLWE